MNRILPNALVLKTDIYHYLREKHNTSQELAPTRTLSHWHKPDATKWNVLPRSTKSTDFIIKLICIFHCLESGSPLASEHHEHRRERKRTFMHYFLYACKYYKCVFLIITTECFIQILSGVWLPGLLPVQLWALRKVMISLCLRFLLLEKEQTSNDIVTKALTGRPGGLRFVGSQSVGHDWATELNWTELNRLRQ